MSMSNWEIASAIKEFSGAIVAAIKQHGEAQITAAKINANASAHAAGNHPRYEADGTVKGNDRYKEKL